MPELAQRNSGGDVWPRSAFGAFYIPCGYPGTSLFGQENIESQRVDEIFPGISLTGTEA